MTKESENENDRLTDETRQTLKNLSKAMLRLHSILLDAAKAEYEAKNGKIASISHYFQLVIDDPHFSWLRKFSSLIALIDEAVSVRRPAKESEALALFNEARILMSFEDADEEFNDRFQMALLNNPDAVVNHNDALAITKK